MVSGHSSEQIHTCLSVLPDTQSFWRCQSLGGDPLGDVDTELSYIKCTQDWI